MDSIGYHLLARLVEDRVWCCWVGSVEVGGALSVGVASYSDGARTDGDIYAGQLTGWSYYFVPVDWERRKTHIDRQTPVYSTV